MASPSPVIGRTSPDAVLGAAIAGVLVALLASGIASALLGEGLRHHLGWLPPCPLRALTGLACPGCGMTRALLLLAELRVGEALASHPIAPLLLAAMVWKLAVSRSARLPGESALAAGLLVVAVGVWAVREFLH